MNKSRRHHYLPEFYTKNFTNADGFLFVYNKVENKIIKTERSPKSIFYEFDRNTIDFKGSKSDVLELFYSKLDNRISIDINNIIKKKSLSPEQLMSVALLANQLKWRVPKNDNEFKRLRESLTKEDLGMKVIVKGNHSELNNKAVEFIENQELFKESKRILLSTLPFFSEKTLSDIYENSFINSNKFFPSVIGDNPILEKEHNDINKIEDFIFPLSSSETFIYKKGTNKQISNPYFYIQRNLAIMNSSEKYIGCKSKECLENICILYNKIKKDNKTNEIHKHLFKFIN